MRFFMGLITFVVVVVAVNAVLRSHDATPAVATPAAGTTPGAQPAAFRVLPPTAALPGVGTPRAVVYA